MSEKENQSSDGFVPGVFIGFFAACIIFVLGAM